MRAGVALMVTSWWIDVAMAIVLLGPCNLACCACACRGPPVGFARGAVS